MGILLCSVCKYLDYFNSHWYAKYAKYVSNLVVCLNICMLLTKLNVYYICVRISIATRSHVMSRRFAALEGGLMNIYDVRHLTKRSKASIKAAVVDR